MQEEIKRMRADIQKTEDDIARLLEEGTVCDKVKGGLGGIQGFKIEGFPVLQLFISLRFSQYSHILPSFSMQKGAAVWQRPFGRFYE